MLRVLFALVVVCLSAPSFADQASNEPVVAQEQKPPQQAPKRDCERKQGEGVS
jgi:hypothetical protein